MIGIGSISALAVDVSAILDRNARRIVNGLRLTAGLDRPGVGCTPRTVIRSRRRARLMHYTAGAGTVRPAILLVPSLINRSYIWDLRHGDSLSSICSTPDTTSCASTGVSRTLVMPTTRCRRTSTTT
jgi:hypothetical protein